MKRNWWTRMRKKKNQGRKILVGHAKLVISFLLFVIGHIPFSKAFPQTAEYLFRPGEQAVYGAYYNWHFIWLNAGEVEFSVDTIKSENIVLKLSAIGKTYKTYDYFYTVRDTFRSELNYQSFTPIYFRRVMNHARQHSEHEYGFDSSDQKIYSNIQRTKDDQAFNDTLTMIPGTYDILSTAYYFRSFDFASMKKGDIVRFNMLVDNKLERLFFRYLGMEEIKTREDERFRCHKVSVMLLEGDFFPKGEHMKVWFTNDKNKLPVMVETEIAVGSVKAILTGYKNLKYPLTSKIESNGKR